MEEKKYDLDRYKEMQQQDFGRALNEVRNGRKTSHWIWYIFPQLRGLGTTSMSIEYGIKSLDEAKAYMEDAYLAGNLLKITDALLELEGNDPYEVFGSDAKKVRSSMTLFAQAAPNCSKFRKALEKYYDGREDERTLQMLEGK